MLIIASDRIYKDIECHMIDLTLWQMKGDSRVLVSSKYFISPL
jgi:hypothetical protein